MASRRAVTRVEIVGRALGADDRHGMGTKQRIEPFTEPERSPVALKVDMGDLTPSMHAGVRAPRAMGGHALSRHRQQGAFQSFLNPEPVFLPLPANELRAVI